MAFLERLKVRLVGTPIGKLGQRLMHTRRARRLRRDPRLHELAGEGAAVERFLHRCLRPGMRCVDAGAHIGSVLSEIVHLTGHERHVAIEPTPRKATWLRRKFPRTRVHQFALGSAPGRATFYDNAGASGLSGLRMPGASERNVSKYEVEIATLDDLLAEDEGGAVDFLKVDVEGAELAAFQGARRTLTQHRPRILFECTQTGLTAFDLQAEQVHEELAQLGFDVFVPGDYLSDAAPLSAEAFAAATRFPFRAFNFVAIPR